MQRSNLFYGMCKWRDMYLMREGHSSMVHFYYLHHLTLSVALAWKKDDWVVFFRTNGKWQDMRRLKVKIKWKWRLNWKYFHHYFWSVSTHSPKGLILIIMASKAGSDAIKAAKHGVALARKWQALASREMESANKAVAEAKKLSEKSLEKSKYQISS